MKRIIARLCYKYNVKKKLKVSVAQLDQHSPVIQHHHIHRQDRC